VPRSSRQLSINEALFLYKNDPSIELVEPGVFMKLSAQRLSANWLSNGVKSSIIQSVVK